VVPHIVRTQQLDPVNLRTIDTGVGTAIELRHISSDGPANTAPAPALPPVRPSASTRPGFGTVPGQTAAAAGPAALAELRSAADGNGDSAPAAAQPAPISPAQSLPAQTRPIPPPGTPGARVSFALTPPPGPQPVGTTFKVPVMLNGGTDVSAVPLQIQYDTGKLSLVNVDSGDLLGRDGQAVALVHREDGGNITVNASRPPGAAGISGSGTVCVLSFQAKAAGASDIVITRPSALNSAQQPLAALGARATVQVQ
jgi:general secretion pathway protein D